VRGAAGFQPPPGGAPPPDPPQRSRGRPGSRARGPTPAVGSVLSGRGASRRGLRGGGAEGVGAPLFPVDGKGQGGVSERPPRRLQRRPKTQPAGPELTEQPPAVPAPRCPALVAAVRCAGPPRGRSARCHQLQRCEQPAARAGIG